MQRALFLLMIESECELHLNSTYSLTELSDETDCHSPHTGRSSFFFFTFYVLINLLSDYLLSFFFFLPRSWWMLSLIGCREPINT